MPADLDGLTTDAGDVLAATIARAWPATAHAAAAGGEAPDWTGFLAVLREGLGLECWQTQC